jgi:hypothetical protein
MGSENNRPERRGCHYMCAPMKIVNRFEKEEEELLSIKIKQYLKKWPIFQT